MDTSRTVGDPDAGLPDVTTSPARIVDATPGTLDSPHETSPVDDTRADSAVARGSDDGGGSAAAGDAGTPSPVSNAGAQDAGVPPPPVDSGSSVLPNTDAGSTIKCTIDLAACLLANPLNVEGCLNQLSTCDAIFSGDGGREAACDTRLATCLLGAPLDVDECYAERMRCAGQP